MVQSSEVPTKCSSEFSSEISEERSHRKIPRNESLASSVPHSPPVEPPSGSPTKICDHPCPSTEPLNIIKGVASALLYLHEEWEQVVLHRDIKSSNILLDAELNGRLGDFGLARFHDRGQNLEATRVVGTIGYMAPELTAMGVATTKTDVYAFGSFILEVVCGRRPVDPERPVEQMILMKWVATCGSRDNLMITVDSKLEGNFKAEEVKMLLKLGMLCSQSNPENRPSMRHIVQYLEGNVPVPSISFDTTGFGMPNISNETPASQAAKLTSSDSGRIVELEYNKEKNVFDRVHQETFGKSGDMACLDIAPVPEGRQRSRFLAVGSYDNTVRILSLDPDDRLQILMFDRLGETFNETMVPLRYTPRSSSICLKLIAQF
ncbi:hypothetical protein F2Q70_00014743 [Brassica cretica]|uniref:non-specific serine/threonine protein kinase n=1 Tax=Brassica cretica TaxID=69181 RepID=A0A8S9HSH7_BRACR|nr:hypothetical protein F2Q70_00014743 [Brassica cretica]